MYLNRLSTEQKELFLDLCIHAAMANNNFAVEEKDMIDQYCLEMQLAQPRYTAVKDTNAVIDELKKISTPQEMKMILLEITGLILSDNIYDDDEQKFMNSFAESIGVDKSCLNDMVASLNELKKLYLRIDSLVMG